MKRYLVLLSLLALLALAVVPVFAQDCEDALGCVVVGPDEPVVIGYMLTTSGATAFLGEDSLGGIEIAILNRDGELLGHEIELVGEDSLCSSEGGQAAAQRIAADETVLGIVGTNCSSAAAAALPIISEAGLVLVSPSNTAPTLTNADSESGGTWQPGYFRTAHNDLFQGAVAATFAYDVLGATTLATIHDGSPYADGLQSVMADTFVELGGEVTYQGAVNVGDTDMTAILTEIATNPPGVLYFPIFEPEADFIAAQAKSIPGLEATILMSADGSLVDSFPENTGAAAVGMYLSGPFISGEAYDVFLEQWAEEIGGVPPSGFHAHAYDAANMILDAIEAAAIETDDGGLIIGRQAVRDALAATSMYPGLTGTLTCGPTGDCATGEALAIFEITQEEVDGNWPPPVFWTLGQEDGEG
jgi:branched-chain amino acid transport system substrate-binding protein